MKAFYLSCVFFCAIWLCNVVANGQPSNELLDSVGSGGYMLHASSGREIYRNELTSLKLIDAKAMATDAFQTTAYWQKSTCDANPFVQISNFTVEAWVRWNEQDRGEIAFDLV